ncbi:hypothetical protein ACFWY9_12050 [Amycolatopsis sp. NPDC059027]|uniref:hypothetical protein n=1 Tax=unclassified Amycolatopsis TaxID=2618356 RepID=UPI00366D1262
MRLLDFLVGLVAYLLQFCLTAGPGALLGWGLAELFLEASTILGGIIGGLCLIALWTVFRIARSRAEHAWDREEARGPKLVARGTLFFAMGTAGCAAALITVAHQGVWWLGALCGVAPIFAAALDKDSPNAVTMIFRP